MTEPKFGEWQPIETAPKNETRILCFSPMWGVYSSHFEGGQWQGFPIQLKKRTVVTHWMPLPPAPEGE